nr:hypothetical protein [Piscibacillus salipiscarius]
MKKISFTVICAVFIVMIFASNASATEQQEQLFKVPEEWAESEEMQAQWQQILANYREYLPFSDQDHWLDSVQDGSVFSIKYWFSGIIKFFVDEWIVNGKLLGMLIFLTLLSVFLKLLIGSFENKTVSKVSYLVILVFY